MIPYILFILAWHLIIHLNVYLHDVSSIQNYETIDMHKTMSPYTFVKYACFLIILW
jgi:hypothetical protein